MIAAAPARGNQAMSGEDGWLLMYMCCADEATVWAYQSLLQREKKKHASAEIETGY